MSKTTTLHVHHAFLYISLSSLHSYNPNWPNFELTWGRERQGDKFYSLSLSLSLWTRTRSPFFSFNFQVKGWLGISAEKFQRTQSLFFSDVFIGVDGTATVNKMRVRVRINHCPSSFDLLHAQKRTLMPRQSTETVVFVWVSHVNWTFTVVTIRVLSIFQNGSASPLPSWWEFHFQSKLTIQLSQTLNVMHLNGLSAWSQIMLFAKQN